MNGILVLVALALIVIAALEWSNRRHAGMNSGLNGSWVTDDRDLARTKLDLLALGERAEPFTHKPFTPHADPVNLRQTRHFTWSHGRHAA